jgi:hypothetical protein
MLTAVIVVALIALAFWRSLLKVIIAFLVALLIVGGIQAANAISSIITMNPDQQTEGR